MAYTQLFTHLVFGTYKRQRTLSEANYLRMIKYFNKTITNKGCVPYEINGTANHLHFLISMHPTLGIATLVKDLKLATSDFIYREKMFPLFRGWQSKYAAFNLSYDRVKTVQAYIQNQKEHHKKQTFEQELMELLEKAGIEYDPKYLFSD